MPKGPGTNPALAALAGNDNVSFKPLVKHVLSKELMLFFEKIRAAILDEENDPEVFLLRESALESVRSDPGLQQLVPYFVHFVAEKVTHSLTNLFVLRQMMELAAAVIANETLFVDPYVSTLCPPVLTCLLGRTLGSGADELKDQYQLRDLASSLIGQIAKNYAKSSLQLRPRLARSCLKHFLDPVRTVGEHYGAINGLLSIGGPEAIRAVILPNLKHFEVVLARGWNEAGQNDEGIRMLMAAIMKAITSLADESSFLINGVNGVNGTVDDTQALEDFLGRMIGSRVAALGNKKLNKAILDAREHY